MDKVLGAIVFTDIKNSSRLWKAFPEEMFKMLKKHDMIASKESERQGGLIIKNIGDSFMIYFKTLEDALLFAVKFQQYFPLKVNTRSMRVRIGIAYGELYKKYIFIQGKRLVDYFGHTVNVSSRLEANVAPVDGIAIADLTSSKDVKDLVKQFDEYKVKEVKYKIKCKKKVKFVNVECRLAEELKGVGELTAFVMMPE